MVRVKTSAWVENLPAGPAKAVREALLGFYKLAGVDLLEEELKKLVDPTHGCYKLSEGQIKIWPNRYSSDLITLELREGQLLPSCAARPIASQASGLLFRNTPILWRDWVETWHEFAAPPANPPPILTSEDIA
jgi:hypothetical protein